MVRFALLPKLASPLIPNFSGIPPGETFTYVVPINESGQHGTYWAHAHSLGQYADGLRTSFNIFAPQSQEPHSAKYDDEFTGTRPILLFPLSNKLMVLDFLVLLGDWYHDEHAVLLKKFISVSNPGGAEPVPDSALIYFVHGNETTYLPPIECKGSVGPTSAVGFNENATLPFEPGKTYRLRVINSSAFAMFFFWIDGHDMRIIEVDGVRFWLALQCSFIVCSRR